MRIHDNFYTPEEETENRKNMALVLTYLTPIFLAGLVLWGITIGTSAHSVAMLAVSTSWMVNAVLICIAMIAAYFSRKAAAAGDDHGAKKKFRIGRDIRMTVLAITATIIVATTLSMNQPPPQIHALEMAVGLGILWTLYLAWEFLLEKSGANEYADKREVVLCDNFGRWSSGVVAAFGLVIYLTGFNDLDVLLAYGVGICMAWESLATFFEGLMIE